MASGVGTGIGIGIGEGLKSIGESLTRKWMLEHAEREKRADAYEEQARAIAHNISVAGGKDNPATADMQTQLQDVISKHNALYQPHETPALLARIQRFVGKKPSAPKPDERASMTPESIMAQTAAPQNAVLQKMNDLRATMRAAGKSEDEIASGLGYWFQNEFKMGPTGTDAEWLPEGKPYKKADGSVYQVFRNKAGITQERPYAGPAESPDKKPLTFEYHPQTGGLSAIKDPNDGATYDASNIATAPPDIKSRWDAINVQQATQLKLKREEEDRRNTEAEKRQAATFAAALDRQQKSFQNSLDKKDYDSANKVVTDATVAYQGAVNRQRTMDQNLKEAIERGDQQAMLSLVANHIGMTLGAQKGARINQAVWDEAVSSTPWLAKIGAKFNENGYLSGVTLAPEQMKSMVKLAHEKVDLMKQDLDDLNTRYQDVLKLNQTPADLKDKTKPQNAAKIFNVAKWKAANPTGDVEAAKAEAKKQGYTIK